jgi:hypothetical protein
VEVDSSGRMHADVCTALKFPIQLRVDPGCLIRTFFHTVTFVAVVVVQEDEDSKPCHIFWN